MRAITSLTCAAALALALAPGVRADENDRLTYMTFSGPVQVPGVTLPAGTYTFKLADGASSRHVVQIFNKDDNKLITTVMTIPNQRLDPVQDTMVMFQERPAGTPVAVKVWFYPGRSIGEEFLYPKQQAMAIARATNESVLTTDGDTVTATSTAGRVDAGGAVTAIDQTTTASTTAPAATADRSVRAPAVGTSGQAPVPESTVAGGRRSLPQTASPIAMLGLLSGLSLAGAFGVRQLRKRQ